MIVSQKKFFFRYFRFFSKGGTLWCRNRQKIFFPFFKNFKNKTQKWLSWVHSNINRHKVMNFGGCNSYPAETARPFTVIRTIMPPPPTLLPFCIMVAVKNAIFLIFQNWQKTAPVAFCKCLMLFRGQFWLPILWKINIKSCFYITI